MVKVGDRIRLSSGKGPDRDGIVTAVAGSMVRVRWPSEAETTIIPAPGTLSVLASSGDQPPQRAGGRATAAKKAAAKKARTSKKGAGEKGAAKKGTDKKRAGGERSAR
jgi:hypothetical protein